MITLLILVALIVLGIFLIHKSNYNITLELASIIVTVLSSVFLVAHLFYWGLKSYQYEIFEAKRNSFEQTLNDARENKNEYETAAIVREVSLFNMELAKLQYNNKTFFFDQYIDDRIDSLQVIK